jgi:hypothetical protein
MEEYYWQELFNMTYDACENEWMRNKNRGFCSVELGKTLNLEDYGKIYWTKSNFFHITDIWPDCDNSFLYIKSIYIQKMLRNSMGRHMSTKSLSKDKKTTCNSRLTGYTRHLYFGPTSSSVWKLLDDPDGVLNYKKVFMLNIFTTS